MAALNVIANFVAAKYYPRAYCASLADRRTVMDRDRRLTGFLRGQTDIPAAPLGFELNNPWRVLISHELARNTQANDVLRSSLGSCRFLGLSIVYTYERGPIEGEELSMELFFNRKLA